MIKSTSLWLIDFQTRLLPEINEAAATLKRATILLDGFAVMQSSVMYSEQYPQGLGGTAPELADKLDAYGAERIVKTQFSAYLPETEHWLVQNHTKTVVLAGVEAHICVYQTALDLIEAGYKVWLAADAVSSRQRSNVELAQEALRQVGVKVIPVESVLFHLLQDAKNPAFKQVSKLIK